jgi:hypothetical protein
MAAGGPGTARAHGHWVSENAVLAPTRAQFSGLEVGMTFGSWEKLTRFLCARGLTEPDGRPLYAYRCTSDEFEEFVDQLGADVEAGARPGYTDRGVEATFCLVGAEWWRRQHDGGPWKWEGILAQIGWEGRAYQGVYEVVRDGLNYFGLKLLRHSDNSTAYLVTLACQGGLPIKMIRQESARLRTYFQRLASRFDRRRALGVPAALIAKEEGDALPVSFRNDVTFEMSGLLMQRVFELQREIGDSRDPVLDLNRLRPNWRNDLPLIVEDPEADALLRGLVEDAQRAMARGYGIVRARRWIRETDGVWHLHADLVCPRLIGAPAIVDQFGVDERLLTQTTRMQLFSVSPNGSQELIAALHRSRPTDDEAIEFEVEVAGRFKKTRADVEALRPWTIVLRSERFVSDPIEPAGGAELSELPWVFAGEGSESSPIRLLAEGSATTRVARAILAIPRDQPLPVRDGIRKIGQIHGADRIAVEVTGDHVLELGDLGRFRVRTGADQDDDLEYRLIGVRAPFAARAATYHGVPSLRVYRNGEREASFGPERLEFRRCQSGAAWRRVDSDCAGRVHLRFVDAGMVRFQGLVTVAPSTTEIHLAPGSEVGHGVITIKDSGADHVEAPNADGLVHAITRVGRDRWMARCRAAIDDPPHVQLVVRRQGGIELAYSVPFPSRGARFVIQSGETLPNRATVSIAELSGIRALAASTEERDRFRITARLRSVNVTPELEQKFDLERTLEDKGDGFFEYELRHLVHRLQQLFALLDDLDAEIRVQIEGSQGQPIKPRLLSVKLFAHALNRDLQSRSFSVPTDRDSGSLEFEALPLAEPQIPNLALRRELDQWIVPEPEMKPGPWLLLGFRAGQLVTRPTLWDVHETAPMPPEAPEASDPAVEPSSSVEMSNTVLPSTLREIARSSSKEQRSEAFKALIDRMASDPSDPEWKSAFALIRRARDLPAVTLDFVKQIVRNHRALTLALFCAPDDLTLTTIWRLEEQLPFAWELISLDAWESSAQTYSSALKNSPLAPDDCRRLLLRPFGAWPSQRSYCDVLSSWIVARSPWSTSLLPELRVATTPQGLPVLRAQLDQLFEVLCQVRAGVEWRQGASIREFLLPLLARKAPAWGEKLARYSDAAWRGPVVSAPFAAAFAADTGTWPSRLTLYELERARRFEPNWFDDTYRIALTILLGERIAAARAPQQVKGSA